MAARNRPRALPKDEADAHEERDLWSRIVNDLKDQTRQSKRINEIADEIAAAEAKFEADDSGKSALPITETNTNQCTAEMTMKEMLHLEQLYKEQLKLSNEEQSYVLHILLCVLICVGCRCFIRVIF
jgi:SAGA-associated factor 29